MNFDRERKLLEQGNKLIEKAEKRVEAKLTPHWDDADALEAAIQDCPHCVTKVFAFDRVQQLRDTE